MNDHLFGMLPEDLQEALVTSGTPCELADARRLLAHVISQGAPNFRPAKPIRKPMREAAERMFRIERLELVERVTDPQDNFVKYLFRSADGSLSEAVRIPLAKPGSFSVCLSSQVGCAMRCDFCATGRLGLHRNLEAWEMVAAFVAVRDDLEPGQRLTGAVFMGQGEPFHNYDRVLQAAQILSHPCGGRVDKQAITISTVGLVDKMKRYTREGHKYRLIVSLHSAIAEKRARLLPVAGQQSLSELADAIREHAKMTRDRITVAWTVMGGVNTGADEVAALQELLGDVPLKLNLIDVNDDRPEGYRRADLLEHNRFMDLLQALEVPIVRRYSGGGQRHAACGMLAAKHFSNPVESHSSPPQELDP